MRGGLGCPQNLFFIFPKGNIGSRAARTTARGAPTGLHGHRCNRAAYALKQTICVGVCASERCRRQGGLETNTTRCIVLLVSPPPPPEMPCSVCSTTGTMGHSMYFALLVFILMKILKTIRQGHVKAYSDAEQIPWKQGAVIRKC